MKDVIVKRSLIAGNGLFALRNFHRGEVVLRLNGPTIHYAFEPEPYIGPNWVQVGPLSWKMSLHRPTWRYLNHSCLPNVGLRRRVYVVAMRSIRAGEEITIDYSITETSRAWLMKCACGMLECRKLIRSTQFLPRELFDKYKEFIPAHHKKEYWKEKTYVSHIKGVRGIFAKHPIKKGEHIYHVTGPVVCYETPPDYRIGYKWLAVDYNAWVIPPRLNPWWSMRHSCCPNVGLMHGNQVIAMRNIEPDEELTDDDAMTEADPRWKNKCTCDLPNCRRTIHSVQYLSEELFESYKPFMSAFLKQQYFLSHKKS